MGNPTDPTKTENSAGPLTVNGVEIVPGTQWSSPAPEAATPNGVYIVSAGGWARTVDLPEGYSLTGGAGFWKLSCDADFSGDSDCEAIWREEQGWEVAGVPLKAMRCLLAVLGSDAEEFAP